MAKRNWKHVQPRSLPHAMELCLEYARDKLNRSVDTVAVEMGLTNKWSLYKWVENGNLPARLIRPFESACGANFVTRWNAISAGQLLVAIPAGRAVKAQDIQELQSVLNVAVGRLLDLAAGKAERQEVLEGLQAGLEGLAWHKANVEKQEQPEFDFWEGE
ncbi:hypothetical protein [Methylogaea oryzae]|uniref:Uncharacterized protein n=1 Tax=Methylogaea oryzae TaxID=1295382 RepID=A0A8D5AGZ0_9GAMM|nr:hypothetical protein [Methylogaea oryzae]BBL69716.1 hypothetical protein MoryE10_03220 [Methylogaea oryzae]